ncbi:MAG: carbohydrate ABC transporter substrate-binding protein [bacterium]|nr:carbohydrate ABC transporter substrate-binding protein [bacterium]
MRRGLVFISVILAMVFTALGPAGAKPPPDTVTILAPFSAESAEGQAFVAELDGFMAHKNFVIDIDAYGGNDDLFDRIYGEDPPDIIISPQPGTIRELASELVDMGEFVNPKSLRRDFGDFLIDAAMVDGTVYGAPIKAALKTLVWYRPDMFAAGGYAIPQSFDELVALSNQMVAYGDTPWCNYMESGFATGWLGTDWIEDLLLGAEGPNVYDEWVSHDVLFQDPRVQNAFERFQQMMDTPGYVFNRSLITSEVFTENVFPLGFGDCFMHKQATFLAPFFEIAGFDLGDFATFRFPSVSEEFADSAMGGGDYVAALADNQRVRQVMRFMVSKRFGKYAIADGPGWILPNLRFNTAHYADGFTQEWAEIVRAAIATDTFRFDASDLMPPEIGADLFWTGVTDILDGVKTIPEVLFEIDAAWPS